MCGRYILAEPQGIARRYDIAKVPEDLRPNFNVAPTQTMPVVSQGDSGLQVVEMRWGIPRFIGPGKVKDVFNTRSDKAFGSWRKLVATQRVLIPASGFYEWKSEADGKHPFFIHPKDDELFSFAGIWNIWQDDIGREIKTYSIMTTEPNKEMSVIHNRMPVILHREDESAWLAPSNNNDHTALESLLRPYEDNGLELYEVSKDVNVVRSNNEHLMLPLNSQ